MSIDLARPTAVTPLPEAVEQVLVNGDLSKLSTPDRLKFYLARCEAAGLDPRCRPFEYISLQGKLTLYAKKECAEQLNGLHGISHHLVGITVDEKAGLIEAMVQAKMTGGRETFDIGIVTCAGLKGEAMANAKMKAVTKAKRRATLSLCGLGDVVDQTELDTITDVRECTPTGQVIPPDNQSGHGRGQYASDTQSQQYLARFEGYVEKRRQQFRDLVFAKTKGDQPDWMERELYNRWQVDAHNVKWAVDQGRLDAASYDVRGLQNRQIGRYTAILYFRSNDDRKALAQETARYISEQEANLMARVVRERPEAADGSEQIDDWDIEGYQPQAEDVEPEAPEPGGADDEN